MRSIFTLLVLSIAFQGILCDCYADWAISGDSKYSFCTSPTSQTYNMSTYQQITGCVIKNPTGCEQVDGKFVPKCIEGCNRTSLQVCKGSCPSGYRMVTPSPKFTCYIAK